MTTTARPTPRPVRALTWLLVATAATTVVVEVLNWWYAEDGGWALAVRTGWGLLRSLSFLILIWYVRRGRAGAKPFGLILAVTTVFAVGRLIVPRSGLPTVPGVAGFVVLLGLCVAVVALLYRSPRVDEHLRRHPGRLVFERSGIAWRQAPPSRPAVPAWLLTARVAAFTFSPLMLVPALVAVGEVIDGQLGLLPVVVVWLVAGFVTSYAVLLGTFFMLRGRRWARGWLVGVTLGVLVIDLPLCWFLLGLDGLIRDGAPLVAAAGLVLYGLARVAHPDAPGAAATAGGPERPATAPVADSPTRPSGR